MSVDDFFALDVFTLNLITDNMEECERDDWERTRFLSWINANLQSTKKVQLEDIYEFPWEKNEVEAPDFDALKKGFDKMKKVNYR